jgi:hypothetical protein
MPHFILLLFKINLVLLLFSAIYYLVLKRLTFYTANRAFLLFGILFSSAYPFIDLSAWMEHSNMLPEVFPKFRENINQLTAPGIESLLWNLVTYVFYTGVIFMAIRLIFQFVSLWKIHAQSKPGKFDNLKVRILEDEVSPFSFWQTIYLNPGLHVKDDIANIIAHEQVHIKQWHTLDILLSEICLVVYWFNPGVWLMKKAVRENIEFITDAKILNEGVDKKSYQYSLLQVGTLQPSLSLVNNFNLSDLRKRIVMMNTKRSNSLMLTRYLVAIPVLVLTLAFTINKKVVKETLTPLEEVVVEFLPKQNKPLNLSVVKAIKVKINSKDKYAVGSQKRNNVLIFERSNAGSDSSATSPDTIPLANRISAQNSIKITNLKIITANKVRKINVLGPFMLKDSTDKGKLPGKGTIIISNKANSNAPTTYLINGKEASAEDLKQLSASRIVSLKVNKVTGSIEITTKD